MNTYRVMSIVLSIMPGLLLASEVKCMTESKNAQLMHTVGEGNVTDARRLLLYNELFDAVLYSDGSVVKGLLDAKADPNYVPNNNLLQSATYFCVHGNIATLLRHGICVNAKDDKGYTALTCAALTVLQCCYERYFGRVRLSNQYYQKVIDKNKKTAMMLKNAGANVHAVYNINHVFHLSRKVTVTFTSFSKLTKLYDILYLVDHDRYPSRCNCLAWYKYNRVKKQIEDFQNELLADDKKA